MLFCAPPVGKQRVLRRGHSSPNTDGPSSKPPRSWPITAGWPIRFAASPSRRPTRAAERVGQRKALPSRRQLNWELRRPQGTASAKSSAAIRLLPRCRRAMLSITIAASGYCPEELRLRTAITARRCRYAVSCQHIIAPIMHDRSAPHVRTDIAFSLIFRST